MPEGSQTGLPGMKRGIAIGVACSVAILVVALLAFFAVRRRKRILRSPKNSGNNMVELSGTEVWPHEKALQIASPPQPPPLPLVEADARAIYELDADPILPELPSDTDASTIKTNNKSDRNSWCLDDDAVYTQKLQQWDDRGLALNTQDQSDNRENEHRNLPLLTISAPRGSPGDVSPLLVSSWDTSSRCASPVSALPDAHLPSHRHEHWHR
ncbi:uncharacterized protein K460DRAFT_403937 [Cucurbitaria berberidis CBS 394.84]|uniref:Uncharacterized protein n=1 Tax=Cucurbitaria berberidis CBS 394.84 TaxID=1168544 RepID=A0A9P4LB37_9PLEO|nr:uncharacterized protein K460DRAFT_403937 [Cucurbitaria berberidis CBS 394.84]KAF1848660.1 hypothetical protein K460DRAFT_403937 [Cucurbitaria berberidis CBS 394.84]